ncbi:MAG: glycosyltransferase family 2 protein [Candidatus Aminicenantes bacterium]
MSNKSLSVFFPVLNEEGTVARLTQDLLHILHSEFDQGEVIIVDDGSTDGTGQIADELCRQNSGYVRVISHEKSSGYGHALRAGFAASRYDLIFFTDGDYQFSMNDLYTALSLIEDHDMVVGYRQDRKDPRLRIWLACGYNLLVRILFGLKLKDIDCSFKLFKREALEKIAIQSQGYFIDTEIMVKAKKQGLRIKEFGVKHLPRTSGKSKVRMKHMFITLHEIIKLWKGLH